MDFKNLKTFRHVVENESFMRAAEELNYAQSTVTMQMQKLESELGVQLIERGKNFGLTEAGRMLYEKSLHLVEGMEMLQVQLSDLRNGETGHVRIGVTEPTGSYRLPRILHLLLEKQPKIEVSVDFGNTSLLSEKLRGREIDFALCSTSDLQPDLHYEPLFDERFVVLLPENHPLHDKEAVDPEDLRVYRLLITADNCPYRRKLDRALQERGAFPQKRMVVGSMTALKYYVQNGLGIALIPEITVDPLPSGTLVRPMTGNTLDMSFGIISRSAQCTLSSAALKAYEYIKSELREN